MADKESKIKFKYINVDALVLSPVNPRTHTEAQVKMIAESIKQFGFIAPIVIDANSVVVAGHGRLAAARLLEMKQVPCVLAEHLTEEQRRAYLIADNKITEFGDWDFATLAQELRELTDLDMDLSAIGFDMREIDRLIAMHTDPATTDAGDAPQQAPLPPADVEGDDTRSERVVICYDTPEEKARIAAKLNLDLNGLKIVYHISEIPSLAGE